MKKSFLLAAFLLVTVSIFAQNELIVQRGDKGLYLNHTVAPKESFYSIGRLYNLPPGDIAAFNGLDMNQGLDIDQLLMIPLSETNFSQVADKGRPVFYIVAPKEGLYRVSQNNNNVLMASLRKWNHLVSDNIQVGQKLIIGYLISPQADRIPGNAPVEEKLADPLEIQEGTKDTVETVEEKKTGENKIEEKKPEPVQQPIEKKNDPPPARQAVSSDGRGGYFRSHYEAQVRTRPAKTDVTVSAGIFKTSSGWEDGKYYALLDGVDPGTIVKVTNPTNGKQIYAKVLGEMSGIRQNQGYDLRISNAAASALEVTDTEKFIVKLNH